jgi:phosphoglycolate phosphatase
MGVKLVIFDLDGTLVDSLSDLTTATNLMLAAFDRPQLAEAEVRQLVGQGARRLVERALAGAPVEEVERGLSLFLEANAAHIADRTRLYPGARETLDRLLERGMSLAIISNKNAALCCQLLEALEVDEYFDEVLGADSVAERKPSPVPILHLLDRVGLAPPDAVMVGDSVNDIAAGKGAGVVTVGCDYGYGGPAELAEANFRIATLPELLSLPLFG